jgi:anti-sigma factor RsiW
MGQHPTDEDLNAFLTGALRPAERNAILLHLSHNCPECQERLARLGAQALGLGPERTSSQGAAYDDAIDRALAAARRQER